MSVHFDSSQIKVLAAELGRIPNRATRLVADVVQDTAKRGNTLAKTYARQSAGAHGKLYHRAFSAESSGLLGLTWVYGPDASMPQGGMSFERGSRNQPPHMDLARSADVIAPSFRRGVSRAIGRAFDE